VYRLTANLGFHRLYRVCGFEFFHRGIAETSVPLGCDSASRNKENAEVSDEPTALIFEENDFELILEDEDNNFPRNVRSNYHVTQHNFQKEKKIQCRVVGILRPLLK